ncbi:MAG: 16S rRNA (uracil(1498)-N(3))-methyltransferase, partial [Candidatus Hydrogenedentes bacterium]|nr:16S rRNA (uracil(1498)-N(3))-methyltransferase [Candidatus Hydrogenedentota bacterium]
NRLEPVPLREAVGSGEVALVIGPEGDFSDEELEVARGRGAQAISLGPVTFRSEVAAALLAALVVYERGGLGRAAGPT